MSDHHRNAPVGVVVGYDGSGRAEVAVARAAEEAVRRRTRLAVALVAADPAAEPGEQQAADDERALRELVARTRRRRPGLTVTAHRATGDAAASLRDLSERAVLLVVGARGRGSESPPPVGLLGAPVQRTVTSLGSVSRTSLHLASCPVLVVPETVRAAAGDRQALVVAGVDNDGTGPAVLRAALEEALRREGRVRLLHAYADRPPGAGLQRARAFSRELVRDVAPTGAAVTAVVTPEPPGVALSRHAADADVLVVGARGSSTLTGLLADSVSRAVIEALPCTVLVVTPRSARRLAPAARTPAPGIPRLPSARVPSELAARSRARQASPLRSRP